MNWTAIVSDWIGLDYLSIIFSIVLNLITDTGTVSHDICEKTGQTEG